MSCILHDIEFYNAPDGRVMVTSPGEDVHPLTEADRRVVTALMEMLKDRYPEALEALAEEYGRSSKNPRYYEFRMVHRFVRCNFGEYDLMREDIDCAGEPGFEEVRCPLRGQCRYEGIICKPRMETRLTEREVEVLQLIAEGLHATQIAGRLHLSPCTINRHRENIKAKTGCNGVARLTAWWKEHEDTLKH